MKNPHEFFPPTKEEAWQRNLTRQFFKDLSDFINASPLVIFFDQYEKADQLLKDWLTEIFLHYITIRYPIVVVISGRELIKPPPSEKGCRHFPLEGVTVDWYHRYVEDCKVKIDSKLVTEFHKLLHGRPKEFVEYVKTLQGAVQ